MAKFEPSVDVWTTPEAYLKRLQPGQHVTANGAKGRFAGWSKGGTIVVVWRGRGNTLTRLRALRTFYTA